MKKISVCMATFNGELFIKDQISSILGQLSENDELIISDDGSTDKTVRFIKEFQDRRIHLYCNHFHNHILNFEFALQQATGDYIFLSDQDDIWVENKVAIMTQYLERGYCLVCSECYVTNANLDITHSYFSTIPSNKRTGFIKNFIRNNFLGCCLAFHHKVLDIALPFPKDLITHDMWIGLIAECVGKVKFIDDRLIFFRRHSNNTSHTLLGSTLSFKEKISYRFVILCGIIKNLYLKKVLIKK